MSDETIVIAGKENVQKARILALKSMLKLELVGMTRSGRSAYTIVKAELGFKGSKQKVYEQLVAYCNENILNK